MPTRSLAALCAGASVLVLIPAARAQDAHDHHDHQPPAADPHAGHAMPMEPAPEAGHAPEHGPDHGAGHAMTSAYGPWSMNRDASGTAWQPDMGRHGGVHHQAGDWTIMTHATLNLVHSDQSGPRGDDDTFLAGMLMTTGRRDFADGSKLTLRGMISPDPWMGAEGYPLLLAAGETADGVTPLVDRQHPHDLFMELSASYSRALSDDSSVFAYVGLPGEPAFGPPAFMHRMSAMDSPEAPITHHWLDSTHIVFGVATLGDVQNDWKVEVSSFRGREPDQDRFDIEEPDLDSVAMRLSWNPSPEWSLQASWADVSAPEQLHPDDDETKWSASAIHARRIGADGWWSSTAAWGRREGDHDAKDAWLLETAFSPDNRWTVFARAERIDSDELVPGGGGHHGETFTVSKASVGVLRDWVIAPRARLGFGALYSVNDVPGDLAPLYGDERPTGSMVFMRLKID